MMEHVPDDVVGNAYDKFKQKYYPNVGEYGVGLYFWNFVGMRHSPVRDMQNGKWYFELDVANRIRMMAGSHFETVSKMMEINGADWQIKIEYSG